MGRSKGTDHTDAHHYSSGKQAQTSMDPQGQDIQEGEHDDVATAGTLVYQS